MSAALAEHRLRTSGFSGLRLSADEYFALPDDGAKYELIDGVVVMSPSPTPRHQSTAFEILLQLGSYVRSKRLGLVLHEVDVRLGKRPGGRDLIYRPEIIFIAAARVAQIRDRIEIVPDLVVEVISPDSRSLDCETKFADYEQAGVGEYWMIDPPEERMSFFRLTNGRFVEAVQQSNLYSSVVVPGFQLDLAPIREAFRSLG